MSHPEKDLTTFLKDFIISKETVGFLSGFIMAVVFVVWLMLPRFKNKPVEEDEVDSVTAPKKKGRPQEQGISKKQLLKMGRTGARRFEVQFSHPSLAGHLKGHLDCLTDFSFDNKGRYLVTASQDRSLRIWYVKDFNTNDHRCARATMELDFATKVRMSPDSKALLVYSKEYRKMMIYRLNKTIQGTVSAAYAGDFTMGYDDELLTFDVASFGTYILAAYKGGHIQIYSVKGEPMHSRDFEDRITVVELSPSSERIFFGTPEGQILVYSVKLTQSKSFHSISFEGILKHHTGAILDISVSGDTTRLVSLGGDGKWVVWDAMKECNDKDTKPYIAAFEFAKAPPPLSASAVRKGRTQVGLIGLVAISPDTLVTAIAQKSVIRLFQTENGDLLETIESTKYDDIDRICFSPDGLYLVTMSSVNEECVARIWCNPHGLRMELVTVERKLHGHSPGPVQERLVKRADQLKSQLRELYPKKKTKAK